MSETSQFIGKERRAFPRELEFFLFVSLLAYFAYGVLSFARSSSAVFDEPIHLVAGYTYDRWNDYRLNPEHPPLIKKVAALPWVRATAWPQDLALRDTDLRPATQWDTERMTRRLWALGLRGEGAEASLGQFFLYGVRGETFARFAAADPKIENPFALPTRTVLAPEDFYNDHATLLYESRRMLLPFGLLLGVLVWAWARELFGPAGGLVALALFCADPNFTAHCGLVTTDAGIALCIFASIYFLWRVMEHASFSNKLGFCLAFAAAFTVKFSAVLLLPMIALAVLGATVQRGSSRLISAIKLMFVAGLTAWGLIWAVYDFRFSAATDVAQAAKEEARSGLVASPDKEPGHFREVKGQIANFFRDKKLLPEAFIYGVAAVGDATGKRGAYLRGETNNEGFLSYFAWVLLLKTPLVTLLLTVIGTLVLLGKRGQSRLLCWFVLASAGFYFATASWMRFDIGVRHLLPVYPFLFVLGGGAVLAGQAWSGTLRWLSGTLVLALILLSGRYVFATRPAMPERPAEVRQRVLPHPLAYFNELAGGPFRGGDWLNDSNLDWGQDLPALKYWLGAHGETQPIALLYFGMADPRAYGIAHDNLEGGFDLAPIVPFSAVQPGQLLVVSATKRSGAYLSESQREGLNQLLARSTLLDCVGSSLFIYRVGN